MLRLVLLLSTSAVSIIGLRLLLTSFADPDLYMKDFIQEYLLARANLIGIDSYLSLPELAKTVLGHIPVHILNHAPAHPPPIVLLSLPFGLLSFQIAALMWFVMECSLLFLSLFLLLKWLEIGQTWKVAFLASFLAFGWEPLLDELLHGQLEIVLLFLCIGVWLCFTRNKKVIGGILLGTAISIKFLAWPILFFFVLRREWRFVLPACLTFLIINLIAGIVIGWNQLAYYYLVVGPLVTKIYHTFSANFSLFSVGWRIFAGTGSPDLVGILAEPLISSSIAADLSTYIVPLGFLLVILNLAGKAKSVDIAFAILVSASLLLNPIVWRHYLVIAILPAVIVGRYLINSNPPKSTLWLYLLVLLLLYFPQSLIEKLVFYIGGVEPNTGVSVTVSFWASLITLVPILPILGLIWLGARSPQSNLSTKR